MRAMERRNRRGGARPLLALRVRRMILAGGLAAGVVMAERPPGPWQQVASPAEYGWNAQALEAARETAVATGSAAVMVIDGGRVVAAWGDIERRFRTASARKSLVAAMFGEAIESGRLRLDATLAELGIDDHAGLSEIERRARLEDLLASRSGVYHPAAKEVEGQKRDRPARGSHPPGSHWFYNNWDFNVAGQILARAEGKSVVELFDERLAKPLGMEDWRRGDGWEELEPSVSRWAAWEFRISTRDLARFGQMVLDRGRWEGRPVVPAAWLDELTRIRTDHGAGSGYGLMWWVHPGRVFERPPEPVGRIGSEPHVAAIGAGGQVCIVFPDLGVVVVHRGDSDNVEGGVSEISAFRVADAVLAARRDGPRPASVATGPLRPVPFAGALPAPVDRAAIDLDAATLERLAGEYDLPRGGALSLVVFDGRLFGSIPGRNQIEFLAETPNRLFSRSAPVLLEFDAAPGAPVREVRIELRGQAMRARRALPAEPGGG